ncbi:MAG: peptide chain release factor N(5)-glutamine methyltransferase [Bdellovibrionota bacterium]
MVEQQTHPKQVNPSSTGQWTIQKIITWSTDFLKKSEVGSSARLDVELLLCEVLKLSRIELYTNYDRPLTESERAQFKELLKRRRNFEPIAYILGHKQFYKHTFKINEHALIPRSDTEILLEEAVSFLRDRNHESAKILDLGTGCGCIALSLAQEFSSAQVLAVDISPDAIKLSKENSDILRVNNVSFECSDIRIHTFWESDHRFDLIVSNPPYICPTEKDGLPAGVLQYEPHLALFAEDEGTHFYKLMAKHAKKLLAPKGKLIVEVGYLQSQEVAKIFEVNDWTKVSFRSDYAGHVRVVSAQLAD